MHQPVSFSVVVGSSKDCNWMSSSLITPANPSPRLRWIVDPAEGSSWRASGSRIPFRATPIASISSMNPIAPPSRRAALRSCLKKLAILRLVWPK